MVPCYTATGLAGLCLCPAALVAATPTPAPPASGPCFPVGLSLLLPRPAACTFVHAALRHALCGVACLLPFHLRLSLQEKEAWPGPGANTAFVRHPRGGRLPPGRAPNSGPAGRCWDSVPCGRRLSRVTAFTALGDVWVWDTLSLREPLRSRAWADLPLCTSGARGSRQRALGVHPEHRGRAPFLHTRCGLAGGEQLAAPAGGGRAARVR